VREVQKSWRGGRGSNILDTARFPQGLYQRGSVRRMTVSIGMSSDSNLKLSRKMMAMFEGTR
jgi:hypothetical protein